MKIKEYLKCKIFRSAESPCAGDVFCLVYTDRDTSLYRIKQVVPLLLSHESLHALIVSPVTQPVFGAV